MHNSSIQTCHYSNRLNSSDEKKAPKRINHFNEFPFNYFE